MSKSVVVRKQYIDKTIPFINTGLIKVYVGQRRVGKSFVLKMIKDYIVHQRRNVNIIYIDKEQYEFDFINDYHELIRYVEENHDPNTENYLFIDEVQEIKSFEKALRHLQNKEMYDIYCTGSNAQMLSGDLATLLSGRYVKINVLPLSYSEFLEFNQLDNSDESLLKYLKWGGLPFIKNLFKDDQVIFDYLKNIISTIIYKDVIYRYKIRNIEFFDNLLLFIASNTGNLITAKKISDYLKSQKIDISPKVVLDYLQYLQNAYLINKVKRVEINTKKTFAINNKYFFEDWGLRNALLGLHHYSLPDVLENVVFAHLKRLGYSVSVGVLKNLEIDFIAQKSGKTIYVQVAYLIADDSIKEREFGNLLKIKDNHPKYVVSMDTVPISDYKGIMHLNLREFLETDL